jgi:hypothetical protein
LNVVAVSSEAIRSWTCRFSPGSCNSFQFACVFQSATGIIIFSQVVIATSTDVERLMDYVEGFSVAVGQTQIKLHFSIFAVASDLYPLPGNLPAGAQWPGKHGLFRRGLFLVHRGSF